MALYTYSSNQDPKNGNAGLSLVSGFCPIGGTADFTAAEVNAALSSGCVLTPAGSQQPVALPANFGYKTTTPGQPPSTFPVYITSASANLLIDQTQTQTTWGPLTPGLPAAFTAGVLHGKRWVPNQNKTINYANIYVDVASGANDAAVAALYRPISPTQAVRIATSGLLTNKMNSIGRTDFPFIAPVSVLQGEVLYVAFLTPTFGGTAPQTRSLYSAAQVDLLLPNTFPDTDYFQIVGQTDAPASVTWATSGSTAHAMTVG